MFPIWITIESTINDCQNSIPRCHKKRFNWFFLIISFIVSLYLDIFVNDGMKKSRQLPDASQSWQKERVIILFHNSF